MLFYVKINLYLLIKVETIVIAVKNLLFLKWNVVMRMGIKNQQ